MAIGHLWEAGIADDIVMLQHDPIRRATIAEYPSTSSAVLREMLGVAFVVFVRLHALTHMLDEGTKGQFISLETLFA